MKKQVKATISKKAVGRKIVLNPNNARATQNLGNGFRRTVFGARLIPANSFLTIRFTAGTGRVVINAGWTITGFASAWPTDSFPSTDTVWILIIENPTNVNRFVTPYLITKTR
ncbi:hypothetical protein [Paenibacillus sp. UNC451MF]|uniref:hypothetical protein n=1 Tax=Paenibacillus sp. UNC451MF TaxID=1449063 RepID=UPI00048EC12E|nr:hypothetical protein [Paenibacillus sp. UNC451MF]